MDKACPAPLIYKSVANHAEEPQDSTRIVKKHQYISCHHNQTEEWGGVVRFQGQVMCIELQQTGPRRTCT